MLYSELCTAIQDYVENSFSTEQLNIFIKQIEQRVYNSVQLPDLRKTTVVTTTQASPYVDLPEDFLSVFAISVTDTNGLYSFLLNKDVNFMREAYPDSTYQAVPKYYALFGPQVSNNLALRIILGPTPDQAYSLELNYFHYPPSIVDAGESWLGAYFDSVLLWGCVLEAYHHLKGEADLIASYQKRYEDALALVKQLGDGKDRQDAYRSGQVRQPVK